MKHLLTYHNVYLVENTLEQPFKLFDSKKDCIWDIIETQDKNNDEDLVSGDEGYVAYLYTVETAYPVSSYDPEVSTATYDLEETANDFREELLQEELEAADQYESDVRREYYSVI